MRLNEWTAPVELVELVDEATNGIPPIDEQVARCGRELFKVAGNRVSIAYGAAVRAYVEALAYAAQLKLERDQLQKHLRDEQTACNMRNDEVTGLMGMLADVRAERDRLTLACKQFEEQLQSMAGRANDAISKCNRLAATVDTCRIMVEAKPDELLGAAINTYFTTREKQIAALTNERDSLARQVEALERQLERSTV